jgi:hypothetical protein
VELRGFEPLTFALPARRSSQLSYSPVELVLLCKVNAGPLAIPGRDESQVDDALPDEEPLGQKVATVEIAAIDADELDLTGFVLPCHFTFGLSLANTCSHAIRTDWCSI